MNDKFKEMNNRKRQAERNVIIGGFAALVAFILYMIGQSGNMQVFVVLAIIAVAAGLIFIGIGLSSFTKIKKEFKIKVLSQMFKELMPNVSYSPDSGLDASTVYSTEFLKRADRFHSEDLITGKVEDVDFICSDVKLEERHVRQTKNGTQVYYVTYFLGRVFCFDFNKEFVGELQVLESGSPISRFKYDKVKLESIEFNKKFKTYTTNDLTAFYILTPDIMEAIEQIEKRNPGKIGMSFHGGKLYVAINNNRDTFELGFFRKIDQSMLEEFKRDFLVIQELIQTLKLNNKLFKK